MSLSVPFTAEKLLESPMSPKVLVVVCGKQPALLWALTYETTAYMGIRSSLFVDTSSGEVEAEAVEMALFSGSGTF